RVGEAPAHASARLAIAKARAVAAIRPDAVVIGSDQTATLDGSGIIGKPGDHAGALAQLRAASGRTMRFHTAVCVVDPEQAEPLQAAVTTDVRFRRLTEREIERYLQRERPYDVAGSAKAEGLGIVLLEA